METLQPYTSPNSMHARDREALALWLDVTSHAVRSDGPDLTARQTAMLLTVYLGPGPHTVRGLAKHLGIGKPAIVRALDALSDASLLMRVPDPDDRRNVFIEGTAQGALQLSDYARNIAHSIAKIARDYNEPGNSLAFDAKRTHA